MSHQNLIVNGDFEADRVVTTASNWHGNYLIEYTPTGWSATPAGVDLLNDEHGKFGAKKTPYGQYVELDGRRNTSIEQTISTLAGQTYNLSFDWALPSYEGGNYSFPDLSSQFQVKVNDEIVFEYDGSYGIRNEWTNQALNFRADSNETKISFTEVGYSDAEGTLLDNIAVTQQPAIRGNSLYTIVDGPSWTEAEAKATKIGGHLATINDHQENLFLNFQIEPNERRWIGLNDADVEGEWVWSSGDNSNYRTWYPEFGQGIWIPESERDYAVLRRPVEKTSWDNLPVSGVVPNGEQYVQIGIAETPFIRRGDSAYVIVEGPTWEEAEANANALGGHLVTINDAEENDWLVENFKDANRSPYDEVNPNTPDSDIYWNGLTQSSGSWEWTSKENLNYTNWGYLAPYGNGNRGQFILEADYRLSEPLWSDTAGKWNDQEGISKIPGGLGHHGIAEIPLAPNNAPTGTPTLTGDFKVGQTINIDASSISDADNVEGWTPSYEYSWEVSNDDGTSWSALTGTDATDGDTYFTITSGEVGKQLRGVVSYLDGYGTKETHDSDIIHLDSTIRRYTQIADSKSQFSSIQGQHGWQYGYYNIDSQPKEFKQLENFSDGTWSLIKNWGYDNFTLLTEYGGHSNTHGGSSEWAVRRWNSERDQRINISGEIDDANRGGGGDGITGRIIHNNVEKYSQLADHGSPQGGYNYEVELAVKKGDTVDFAIDFNSWDGDDTTLFTAYVWNINSIPFGMVTLTGDFKVGQTINIDSSSISDADNFEGWTPAYEYSWEVANDPAPSYGLLEWETLSSDDATDGDGKLEVTEDLAGKFIRGVVTYLDGYGTNEVVKSESELLTGEPIGDSRQLSIAGQSLRAGRNAAIPILISDALGVEAFDLTFFYDTEVFSLPANGDVITSGSLIDASTFVVNSGEPGKIVISGTSISPLSAGAGSIALLNLQVNADADLGLSLIDLGPASFNEDTISLSYSGGDLNILAASELSIADQALQAGKTVEIPILISDADGVEAFDLTLSYDTNVFSLPTTGNVIAAGTASGGLAFVVNSSQPGQIVISGSSTSALSSGEGSIALLNLQVKADAEFGSTVIDLVSASFNEGAISVSLNDAAITILPPSFQVLNVRELPNGLALQLTEAPDLDVFNLYDGPDASVDQADLSLVDGSGTQVALSAHWDESSKELYLLSGSALAAGDYTLAIDSRADGLVTASSGELLDGNADGTSGDGYSYAFTRSRSAYSLSIADTARGAGQELSVNGAGNFDPVTGAVVEASKGIPVYLSSAEAVTSLSGTFSFDHQLLVDGQLVKGDDLPDDWAISIDLSGGDGTIGYQASGTTAISGDELELFRFQSVITADAAPASNGGIDNGLYGSSTLIQATIQADELTGIEFEVDAGLIALAYSGDATGNGTLSSLDASRVQRVVVGLDSGFDAYDDFNSTLIGDTTGNGTLSSLDASRIQQQVVGLDVNSFPDVTELLIG